MSNQLGDANRDNDLMDDEWQLYCPTWTAALGALSAALRQNGREIANRFFEGLLGLRGTKHILESLSASERRHLKARQLRNLYAIAAPGLTAAGHRTMAMRIGRIHAICGVDREELIRSRGILSAAIQETVDTAAHAEALSVLGRRLTRDLAWQGAACQRLQTARQSMLLRITEMAWDAKSYTDLISRVVDILGKCDEVGGCSVGRPDDTGIFRFEAISQGPIEQYLIELETSAKQPIKASLVPQGEGPSGRAWRSAKVERSINIPTDPRMKPWKAVARRVGFRSSVAIPLFQPGAPPTAILTLYSVMPGGYTAADQMAFIAQMQAVLGFALGRIENQQGRTHTVPYALRRRWGALLHSDALQMHYQPLVDLKTGRATRVEALARLRDDGRILTPADFFPALSPDDFLELYVRGLTQTLSQRDQWRRDGIELDVSVNLPSSALGDSRYLASTRQALAQCHCSPDSLTLEILETDALPAGTDVHSALGRFKALGIRLAEDDLGSGHSSLNRLRELPFDCVKIDRSIVSLSGQDPSDVLRFIYQLTRLGLSLGKSVIVEGVEDVGMLDACRILGADLAQGYAIARPMPAQQLTVWMGRVPGTEERVSQGSRLGKLARLLIWEEHMHLDSIVPEGFADAAAQRALIVAAKTHGLGSAAYRSARRQVVTALMRDEAEH